MTQGRRDSAAFKAHLVNLHESNKGRPMSDATKAKIAEKKKLFDDDPANRARRAEQISTAHRGRKITEETRERMRSAAVSREQRKRSARTS